MNVLASDNFRIYNDYQDDSDSDSDSGVEAV